MYISYTHIYVCMFIDVWEFVYIIIIYIISKRRIQQCISDKQQQTHLIGLYSIHFIYRYIIIAFIFYNYIYIYIKYLYSI